MMGRLAAAVLVVLAVLSLEAVAPAPVRAATTYYVGSSYGGPVRTTPADAAGCTGPSNLTCTLRGALSLVVSGDTVRFSGAISATNATTITLTDGGGGTLALANSVTIDGTGKRVAISGGNGVQVFLVNSGVTANLTALTITAGTDAFAAGFGGGISNDGTVTLVNSTVSGNTASSGVGIFSTGTVTLVNSTVSGNTSSCGGCGGGGIETYGAVRLVNSTVSGNTATFGAGIMLFSSGAVRLVNSTVSGNTATFGAGIDLFSSGAVTLVNSTVSGNTASGGNGGGILINGGTITASNSSIAGNTGGDLFGTITNGGNNLLNLAAAVIKLAPLGDYGGPTQTRPPLPGSPALDAGDAAVCAAATTANPPGAGGVDQRGIARPQGSACDIGAVEIRGYSLAPVAGSTPLTASIGTAFAHPIAVTLTETGGSSLPVSGVSVAFAVTPGASGASAAVTGSPALTDSTGIASVPATANGVAGAYTATASATGFAPATFSLANAAVVANISPSSGGTTGGGRITITGVGFGTEAANVSVAIGGATAPVGSASTTQLVVTAPVHAAGAVDVVVTVNGGSVTLTHGYTYGVVNALPGVAPTGGTPGSPAPLPSPRPTGGGSGSPNPLPPARP